MLQVLAILFIAFIWLALGSLFSMLTPKDWEVGRDILLKIGALCVLLVFLSISGVSFILLGALWGMIASMGEFFVGILLLSAAIQIAFW